MSGGESEAPRGWGGKCFNGKSQEGGGGLPAGCWRGTRGRERVCGEFGGGLDIFVGGPKFPPSMPFPVFFFFLKYILAQGS